MADFFTAETLLNKFKGDRYVHGLDVLGSTGGLAALLGRYVLFIVDIFPGSERYAQLICDSLSAARLTVLKQVRGAAPNAPRKDVFRIAAEIKDVQPELLVSLGGGSTTDAVKAADVLATLSLEIDTFFGTGLVSAALQAERKCLIPHLAIQTAASSGAHLTKYANITDVTTGQKKLIVDDAIIPAYAIFDYRTTLGAPASLTVDGALDGISHVLEVLYSTVGKPVYNDVLPIALECIRLAVTYLPQVLYEPGNATFRQAIGLATDLGGYAIMLGGTNGAHLTSFSLVDILSHGRACGMLNPYYTVFFAPAIQEPLREIARLYHALGYLPEDPMSLAGRELGLAVARAMIRFEQKVGCPTYLAEVAGFSPAHITRALAAAKEPQLRMKLENMPVPLTSERVDEYMGSVLLAAQTGNLDLILNLEQPA